MRDLVLAGLTNRQLETVERHLAQRLYTKAHLSPDQRTSVVAYYLRVVVEQRLREVEHRTDDDQLALPECMDEVDADLS